MKRPSVSRSAALRGFTLIELLVVITIIALLAAGAYGAFGVMMEKAKKTEAQSTCGTIINGINQFQGDYDTLPRPTSATPNTDCQSDTGGTELLVAILKGMDPEQNSRGHDYLGDIKDAKTMNDKGGTQKHVAGIVRDGESIELYDPWGSYYKVNIDLDYDGKLENPNTEAASSGTTEIHKTSIAYSIGKDMDEMKWEDNVSSWAQQ
jgi:prepilin-type N-terminal cleavage/methylation domain-containing protein